MIHGPLSYKLLTMSNTSKMVQDLAASEASSTTEATVSETSLTRNGTASVTFHTNGNQTLMLVVLVLVGVILLILVLAILVYVFRKLSRRFGRVECHVCLEKVDRKLWNASHRSECQKRNLDFLKTLPEPFDVRCPQCLAYLKLMPKWCGKRFKCDDGDCPFRGGMIQNHGYNRFSCFSCDFDLCDSCVHRKLFVLTKVVQRQSNHPPENCDICELNVDFHPVGRYNADNDDADVSSFCDVRTFCYVNKGFTLSDPPSYRESPSPMPRIQMPYILSTYV